MLVSLTGVELWARDAEVTDSGACFPFRAQRCLMAWSIGSVVVECLRDALHVKGMEQEGEVQIGAPHAYHAGAGSAGLSCFAPLWACFFSLPGRSQNVVMS